jgi:hypothetical protein
MLQTPFCRRMDSSLSAPPEKHQPADYMLGWKRSLTDAQEKTLKAEQDDTANIRRLERALANLMRLKEARVKLETVGVALVCPSLTNLR